MAENLETGSPRRWLSGTDGWHLMALAVAVSLGVLLRAWPLLRGEAWLTNIDLYDDGVYQAAAALWARGVWPYRDFTFVHPPGLLLALLPTAVLDPTDGYPAARWLALGIGAVNLTLVAAISKRAWGFLPALVATAAYACHADASVYERGPFLEGFLNCASLAMCLVWLQEPGGPKRPLLAGVLGGLACTVKLWGGIWLLLALVASLGRRPRRELLLFALAAGLTAAAIALPFAARDPMSFFDMVVRFHTWRPPDGIEAPADRLFALKERYGGPLLLIAIGAGLGLLHRTWKGSSLAGRLAAGGFAASLGALLLSKTFWIEYSAFLAPFQALAVAATVAVLLTRVPAGLVGACALVLAMTPIQSALALRGIRSPEVRELGQFLSREAAEDCIVSLEPTWLLAANRLPGDRRPGSTLVDSYGSILVDAMRAGTAGRSLDAMRTERAQQRLRDQLRGCWVLPGGRDWQLDAATVAWLASDWDIAFPPPGEIGLRALRPRTPAPR